MLKASARKKLHHFLLVLCTTQLTLGCDDRADTPHASTLRPGTQFDDCRGAAWCPQMIVIPSGTFRMGSPADEPDRFDDEGPSREVAIQSFGVGKFEVTRAQWKHFATATTRSEKPGCAWAKEGATWSDVGFPQDDDHPVVCISWTDAQDYLTWLSAQTRQQYRLLTEAEWEYAARAGTSTAFSWGSAASHEFANYGADECCAPMASGRDQWLSTSPVGSFPSNAFGIFDMHGNVFEWVQDCYAESYASLRSNGAANDPKQCTRRVARGGVYGDRAQMLRSAARNWAPPPNDPVSIADYRSSGFGFRVARSIDQHR